MTWRTQIGERTLEGAEAALMRIQLFHVVGLVDEELEGHHDGWEFGIDLFDSLAPRSKLAMLAEVGEALLRPTAECPKLNALNEATVAALFRNMEQGIEIELDCQDKMGDPTCLRRTILAAAREVGELEVLPDEHCEDVGEWQCVIEMLEARILWDADFENADLFLDASPERAAYLRSMLTIDEEYYRAIPPDPLESEIPAILAKLDVLCDG